MYFPFPTNWVMTKRLLTAEVAHIPSVNPWVKHERDDTKAGLSLINSQPKPEQPATPHLGICNHLSQVKVML